MKQITILIVFLFFFISCNAVSDKKSNIQNSNSQDESKIDNRKLAFQNKKFISYYDFSNSKTKKLVKGTSPCISPDGKWIAYTQSTKPGKGYSRIIRLISTENFKIKELEINNKNHYCAYWSPTGEYLAFSIFTKKWQVGLIKPNSSEFKIITSDSNIGLYAPTWSQDGKYILAHDLRFLYKFNIRGELIEKHKLSILFGDKFHFSSSTPFWLSSDNRKLIFEADIGEYIEGLVLPIYSIFSFDLNTKTIKRISKKGLGTTDLWLDSHDRIFFSGYEKLNEPRRIFQTSFSDTTLIELIHGTRPSIGQ